MLQYFLLYFSNYKLSFEIEGESEKKKKVVFVGADSCYSISFRNPLAYLCSTLPINV